MLIACPSCQRQLNVPDNAAGKQVRCPAPDCGTVFYVPAAPAPAAAPAAVPAPVPVPVAPAKPVLKPVAAAPQPVPRPVAAPQPAAGSPFDFGGAGGVAGPEADFGFTAHTDGGLKGIGLRTRIGRATGWLNMAAGSMVVFTVFSMSLQIALFVMDRSQWGSLIGAGCTPVMFLPFPVVIVVGARMLARTRRFGMAMTAAIVCLVVGGLALLTTLGVGVVNVLQMIAVASHGMHGAQQLIVIATCSTVVLSIVVAGTSLFGGFVALRTLMNAEVKAAFT
jgi:hypothetical protein